MSKRKCVYREQFSTDYPGIKKSRKGENFAFCEYCSTDVSIANAGVLAVKQHFEKQVHKNNVKIKKFTAGISMFFTLMISLHLEKRLQQEHLHIMSLFTHYRLKLQIVQIV